ncbi:hypothetical protein ACFX15_012664 [Malus domestica]
MLGVWLSRFGGQCLFDLEASNLVRSVFSNVSKRLGLFASLPCHGAQRLTHRDFPIIQQWSCSFTLVGNNMVARPSKFMCLNFVSAVSLLFFYPSCNIHVFSSSPEIFHRMPIISAKLSVHVTGADKAEKVGASSISEISPRGL